MSEAAESPTNGQLRQQDWLNRLKSDFIKLQETMPVKSFLPDMDCPKWVENLEREVGAALFPVAKLKEELKLTPKRLGAIIGHECSTAVWMMDAIAKAVSKFEEEAELKPPKSDMTAEQIEESQKFADGLLITWYSALRRFAKKALCSSVDQNYEDMKEFLLAYSEAFSRKLTGTGAGSIGHSAFEIQLCMLHNWRIVEQLNSVRHLHETLVKAFGTYRVGDLKRIEKICQRIGLRYKAPGRPKRSR